MVTGLAHFAIGVADLDKALWFYRDILGFRVTMDFTSPNGTKIVMLSCPGQEGVGRYAVELFRSPSPRPLSEDHNAPEWLGFKHGALVVDDLDKICEDLKKNGIELMGEPRIPREGFPRIVNLLDPEGNRLELMEYPK